jgi:hypothetical protein
MKLRQDGHSGQQPRPPKKGILVAIRNEDCDDDKGVTEISNSWHLRLEMGI